MSQKGKARRAKREKQEELQAKKVINWIFGALIALAILWFVIFIVNQ